jgi:riboflavin synthase
MFTGLVEAMTSVVQVRAVPPGKQLQIELPPSDVPAAIGESVAINGCCLTVVELSGWQATFEAGPETLARTNLGQLTASSQVNVERSLRVGDRLGGHLVTGHVDGLGFLEQRRDDHEWSYFWFRMPAGLSRQMACKGSIAVDGVSLTLVEVETERFSVALIPHTLRMTTLGRLQPGDAVNLETDLLAKYVERQLVYGKQAPGAQRAAERTGEMP